MLVVPLKNLNVPQKSSHTSRNYRLSSDVRKSFCTFAYIIVIVVIAHLFGQIWDIFILEWQQTIDYRSISVDIEFLRIFASNYISGDYHSTVNIINISYLLIHLYIFFHKTNENFWKWEYFVDFFKRLK